MNHYQHQLYTNLITLTNNNEAFFYKDFIKENITYRIFNYRLASYTDFLNPGALECRGVMFNITDQNNILLVSLPPEKFFNLHENPLTMNLDMSHAYQIELKADGSLISTYIHNDQLLLKTKGSIESEQCVAAMQWLNQPQNRDFLIALKNATLLGYTVNLEWCAPDNRIVIGYQQPHLTVLNVRSMNNGTYVDLFDCKDRSYLESDQFDVLRMHHIERLQVDDPVNFVEQIPNMDGIEGYVVLLHGGIRVKVKTEWYLTQHRAKDSINSDRRLFEAVLAESTDDLRSLFYDDPVVINRIENMEQFVDRKYNHLVNQVEQFYQDNSSLDRKSYAILAQKQLDKMSFGLAMSKYIGKTVDYSGFMVKHWKDFGVSDAHKEME